MTATRSATSATTPRSWVISSTDMPSSSCSSASSARICACTVTSRAVVGSSAISSLGRHASAMAIIARCCIPPESWWGYSPMRWAGSGMRALSSMSSAMRRAWRRETSRCCRTASTIWLPMVKTGLSAVIGSWNIIEMRSPRKRRMRPAGRRNRSCPSNSTRPASTRPGGGTSRITDSAVTLLPQPLSPTRQKVSPRRTSIDTPSTARATPRSVKKWTVSPSSSSSVPLLLTRCPPRLAAAGRGRRAGRRRTR